MLKISLGKLLWSKVPHKPYFVILAIKIFAVKKYTQDLKKLMKGVHYREPERGEEPASESGLPY